MAVDDDIEAKQEELDMIHRSVNALKKQHQEIRAEFEKKLDKMSKEANKKLASELEDKKKELSSLDNAIKDARSSVESESLRLKNLRTELESNRVSLESECSDIKQVITNLNGRKVFLKAEIDALNEEKHSLIKEIDTKHTELTDTNEKINAANESVVSINLRTEELLQNYDFNKKELDLKQDKAGKRLRLTLSQLDIAAKSLHEVQSKEDGIRQELAEWQMSLDSKESALDGREARINQQEKRTFNYNKFSGL